MAECRTASRRAEETGCGPRQPSFDLVRVGPGSGHLSLEPTFANKRGKDMFLVPKPPSKACTIGGIEWTKNWSAFHLFTSMLLLTAD